MQDTKNSADTVGCCSLRVEHVTFKPPHTITLDFLGKVRRNPPRRFPPSADVVATLKDSMRFYNTVDVEPAVFKCLTDFAKGTP